MTIPTEPELVQAFIEHTLTLPNTTTLVGKQVSGRLRSKSAQDPNGWSMPSFAIVFRDVPGPVQTEPGYIPIIRESLQAEFYGPTLRESRRLFRVWRAEMFPDPIQAIMDGQTPVAHGFVAAGCAVSDYQQMGSAAPLQENPTDLPRTVVTLMVRYCMRLVPIT